MEKEKIIAVKDLSFNYGNGAVLNKLNFAIQKADFAGLIGGNGSGKSTLIKLILGRLPALSGSVELFGKNVNSFKDWYKIGYVPQKVTSFNTGFPIYVEELVALPLSRYCASCARDKQSKEERITNALETVGMNDFRKRRIGSLSGGQQQRVFIAKALVTKPELLLLDEPTVGVDQEAEHDIYQLLGKLNREQNMTILWVSHDVAAVSALTNRLLCVSTDGFYEHQYATEGEEVNLQMLYGFAIKEHSHSGHHSGHFHPERSESDV